MSGRYGVRRDAVVAFVVMMLGSTASAARAQRVGIGVAPHVGTLGVGLDVAVSPHSRVSFRAGGNFFPFDINIEASEIDFNLELPSPQFTTLIDLYVAGGFRLTGGLLLSSEDLSMVGDFTGTVDIGDATYTASDVGTLSAAILNNDVGPYIGIGVGNPAGSRFGFFMDLGVAFTGDPDVVLAATGPIATDPVFLQNLAQEQADIDEDLDFFTIYPVLSLGFSIGMPRR